MNQDKQNSDLQSTHELEARLEKLESKHRSPRWWRRTALALLVICASLPFAAKALAPVPNIFVSGEALSAAKMNANFTHLQNAITAVEGRPVLANCADGDVAYRSAGSWGCANVTELLSQKVAWGIVYHSDTTSPTHCSIDESSIAGVTCSFNNGVFTVNTPGWTTHYANDVVTASASWCQDCDNFGIRVDQQSSTASFQLLLTSYNGGNARVNWMMVKR